MVNQNPEQVARDKIDSRLGEAGWVVQGKRSIDLNRGAGKTFTAGGRAVRGRNTGRKPDEATPESGIQIGGSGEWNMTMTNKL
jgi:type I site-specific restriction endonuclease